MAYDAPVTDYRFLLYNIVHLVLAKLPDAPKGTKGTSLFVVPKVIPETGERNSIFCGGLEHKMGIKALPPVS